MGRNQTVGQEWADTYLECRAPYGVGSILRVTRSTPSEVLTCTEDVEWTRALVTLGGVGVVALLATAILFVAPVIVRRRRRLTDVDDQLSGASDRFMALAHVVGVIDGSSWRWHRPPNGTRSASGGPEGRSSSSRPRWSSVGATNGCSTQSSVASSPTCGTATWRSPG